MNLPSLPTEPMLATEPDTSTGAATRLLARLDAVAGQVTAACVTLSDARRLLQRDQGMALPRDMDALAAPLDAIR